MEVRKINTDNTKKNKVRSRKEVTIIGKRIQEQRKKSGYTQITFAKELEKSMDTVMNWEQSWTYPTTEEMLQIAKLLDCDVTYLYGITDPESTQRKTASDYLHLSEEQVKFLHDLSSDQLQGLKLFIDGEYFFSDMLKKSYDYLSFQVEEKPNNSIFAEVRRDRKQVLEFSANRSFMDLLDILRQSLK